MIRLELSIKRVLKNLKKKFSDGLPFRELVLIKYNYILLLKNKRFPYKAPEEREKYINE